MRTNFDFHSYVNLYMYFLKRAPYASKILLMSSRKVKNITHIQHPFQLPYTFAINLFRFLQNQHLLKKKETKNRKESTLSFIFNFQRNILPSSVIKSSTTFIQKNPQRKHDVKIKQGKRQASLRFRSTIDQEDHLFSLAGKRLFIVRRTIEGLKRWIVFRGKVSRMGTGFREENQFDRFILERSSSWTRFSYEP